MERIDTSGLDALAKERFQKQTPKDEEQEETEEAQEELSEEAQEELSEEEQELEEEQEETEEEQEEEPEEEKETPELEKKKRDMVPREVVEQRINRMYARLREAQGNTQKFNKKGDEPLTREEAEAIWNHKENERKFHESETKVLMRHEIALNDDGSFNLKDPFAKAYIDIGRQNPQLAWMVNGPELAEAMVEKMLTSLPKKKGGSPANPKKVHTGKSTVTVSATKITRLPEFKKKIAARMNMTEKEYIDYEAKIKKGDKTIQ